MTNLPHTFDAEEPSGSWPRTLPEALALLLRDLSPAEKAAIAATPEAGLIDLHFSPLGVKIRQDFGLWRGNAALLADCQRTKFEGREDLPDIPPNVPVIHPDDAAMVIVRALWARLRH